MAQGGSGVIPLGGYKLRFYLRLTMPDEISIPGLLKRLLWIENRRCNGILVPYQWVCGSLGRVGGTGGGGRIGGMSFFPEFLTKNLYHEIELYTLMTTLRFF